MTAITLGADRETGNPVGMDDDALTHGTYIVGLNGTGKSTLMEGMAKQYIRDNRGICLIDAHGPLVESVLSGIPTRRMDDIVYLDAADREYAFGLNLFDQSVAPEHLQSRYTTIVVEAFRKAFGQFYWGIQIEAMMRNITSVFLANGNLTLADVPRFLDDKDLRIALAGRVRNESVRIWWSRFEQHSPREKFEYTDPVINRVSGLLDDPLLEQIVSNKRTTVDFTTIIRQRQILLISLPVSTLGQPAVSLLGTVFVGQFLLAALAGAALNRPDPFALFCDEYQRFDTEDFATIFDEMRKGRVALFVAHQRRAQLETDRRKSAPLGARNRVVFQVVGEDAEELAKDFYHRQPEREVIGFKPRMAMSHTPYTTLTRRGHDNPRVRELIREVERKIADMTAAMTPKQQIGSTRMRGDIETPAHTHITDAVGPIRRLMDEMVDTMQRGPAEEMDLMKETPIKKLLEEFGVQFGRCYLAARTNDPRFARQIPFDWFQAVSLWCFVRLVEIGKLVRQEPVMEASLETDPIYGPLRSLSDIRAELSTTLANLPSFMARVKLLQDNRPVEYTVSTMRIPAPTEPVVGVDAVRQASRDRYYRSLSIPTPPVPIVLHDDLPKKH